MRLRLRACDPQQGPRAHALRNLLCWAPGLRSASLHGPGQGAAEGFCADVSTASGAHAAQAEDADPGPSATKSLAKRHLKPSASEMLLSRPPAAPAPDREQVLDVLEADRQPQQVRRAGVPGPSTRGAVLDQALDAAERGRALPQLTRAAQPRAPPPRRP